MTKNMKLLTIGATALTLAAVTTACSSGTADTSSASTSTTSSSTSTPAKDSPKKVTIEYWHTYSDQEEKVLTDEIKPLFEKENPGIELKLTRMPTEGLKQQVIAGVSGNAAPDLMRMDIVWVPEFAKMGALANMSKQEGFEQVRSSLFEGAMATNNYDGNFYGVPVNTNTKVAVYNKKLLQEAGLSGPPTTMKELEDASRALVKKGHKGGIGIGGINMWAIMPYFTSLGGKLTSDDFKKVDGFVNSPASVKALETIVGWQKEGLISPTLLGGQPGSWDGMKSDEYLMIDDGPWFYSILMNDSKETKNPMDYTVRGLIPAGDGGSHSVIGGEDLVIFSNSKHPKEAWTFAKWMMGEEPQKLMAKTGLIPTNKKAANDPKVLEVPFVKEYVKQLETALPRTPIAQWGDMEDILNKSFEKAIRGEQAPKAALDDAAKQIEAVLKH